ncbi:hypothetical protein CSC28_4946 [Pseudomonas paraeruginosa]|nr:hypothetical protein CSC28_4946 [Pseudomonas paraeruginosa]
MRRMQSGCNKDWKEKRKFPESDQRHGYPQDVTATNLSR